MTFAIAPFLSGLVLLLLVAASVELAEVSARLRAVPLRYRDRIQSAPPRGGAVDRLGGVALAVVVMWYFALPWVAQAEFSFWALVLFLAMFTVTVGLLTRVRLATLRYPLATLAPLVVISGAAALT